jgi:hypothetical protein
MPTKHREQKEFLKTLKKKFSEPSDDEHVSAKNISCYIHPTTNPYLLGEKP